MRNKTIDFLRGIAILLTLFRHAPYKSIFLLMKQIGWIGVDLFFVLSGFLVSGLIFDEYAKTNKFDGKQFLIRRGFKIYPAFWFLIICSMLFSYFTTNTIDYLYVLRDFFFVQNYFHDNNITWSLCVEEHFYFLIVFLFILIIKFAKNINKAILVSSVIIILYGILAKTILFFQNKDFSNHTHMFPTHLRIDSLMIGLLIAHLFRNHQYIIEFIVKNKTVFYFSILPGLSLPFIWNIDKFPDQLYLSCFGLPFISLSFGILLILLMKENNFEGAVTKLSGHFIFRSITTIGFYSYSIYLWHILARDILIHSIYRYFNYINGYLLVLVYFFSTITIGITLGKLIEIPFLKIRDKYFPKKYPLA